MVADQLARQPARPLALAKFIPSLYQVGALAVLGAIFVVALSPRLDTDLWWHLQVGKYIAVHHSVPTVDFMSFTFRGHPWTDHEWLAELTMYGLYTLGGLWGPIVAFAALITATFLLVFLTMRQRGIHPLLALFVTAGAFVASSASWGPRIQMVTLFFLALYAFSFQRFQLTRDRRLLLVFPAAMLLWANIHGGFALGLGLLALVLAGEWLQHVTHKERSLSIVEIKLVALTLAGSFAVTIVNPNTYRTLLYPLTFVLPNAYTNLIEESASPNFHMPVLMVFEAMLLLLVAAFIVGRPALNWTHLLVILAFTHLAFSQVRNVPLWAVLVGPLLAYYLQAAGPRLQHEFPRFRYRRRPVQGRVGGVLNAGLLFLVLLVYVLEGSRFDNSAALRRAESDNYPSAAVAYMQGHAVPNRVFVSYSWGGYLLWRLYPRYSDYMDSRADTLYNTAILHGYLRLYQAAPGWRAVIRDYRIQSVLVESGAPIVQVLAHEPGWRVAYRDRLAALLVRA